MNESQTANLPSKRELNATMPCKFSCCQDEQQIVDTFMSHEELDDGNKNHCGNFFFIPTPKTATNNEMNKDLTPTTVMIIRLIRKGVAGRSLRVLFDSGSGKRMMNQSALRRWRTTHMKELKSSHMVGHRGSHSVTIHFCLLRNVLLTC